MKKSKQVGVVCLILAAVFLLPGCSRAVFVDISELNRRLSRIDPAYRIDESALFFQDDVYFYYYSLAADADTLLTVRQDADKRVVRLTLTFDRQAHPWGTDAYRALVRALCESYFPDADLATLAAELHLDDDEAMGASKYYVCELDGFRAVLFGEGTVVWMMADCGA